MIITANFELYESALSSLYEAPTAPHAWIDFMTKFGRLIDARGGQYHLWDPTQDRMGFSVITDEYQEKDAAYYNEHLAPIDPRRRLSTATPAGQWVFDHEHYDAHFVDRSEVYRWLHSFDIRYSAGVRLTDERDMLSVMGLFRAPCQQPFGEMERTWLDRVTPHIQRASKLHLRLETLRTSAALGRQAANALDYPVLIVDEKSSVQFANRAAETMLRLPHAPLRIRDGSLRGCTPSAHEKLSAAVRVATHASARQGNVLGIQHDTGSPVYQVVVLPAPDTSDFASPTDRPTALITLGAPSQGRSVDTEFLRQLFGLSDAEARVVVGLAQGSTLKELADQANVSINTVRTQLQLAFAKTNTHRQAELVTLVGALPRLRR